MSKLFTVTVHAFNGDPAHDDKVVGATVVWDGLQPGQAVTDGAGNFTLPPRPQQGFNITISGGQTDPPQAPGVTFGEHWIGVELDSSRDLDFVLPLEAPEHVNPSAMPLEDRAKIRGAMWTARLDVPWGPRPNQPDNCICIDYFESFSDADGQRIIAAYGPASPRRYVSAPMGPLVDAGYHGQLPSCDWRGNPDPYLDAAQQLEDTGIKVVHFLRPDRGCAGLDWTVDDLERELGPIFHSEKAQRIMGTVCLGWEPGPKYYYDNAWWMEMLAWQARTFPNALRLIHMVADCDAPVGGDDDKKGISNAQGWANVAPYLHGWLVQVGGYVFGTSEVPTPAFLAEFTKLWTGPGSFPDRFNNGYAGWPTHSAWPTGGIRAYAGEYAAFADYWQNWAETYSQQLGDLAVTSGAAGYLDGGTV